MKGLEPWVIVESAGGEVRRRFPAYATRQPGAYRAAAVFPHAGRWSYAVDEGYGFVHTFGHAEIGGETGTAGGGVRGAPSRSADSGTPGTGSGPAVTAADDDGSTWPAAVAALAAGLLTALVVAGVQRRRRGDAGAGATGRAGAAASGR